MRKFLIAAMAGASVLGGAAIAQSTQAQPYGYYERGYHYDADGRRFYDDGYGRHYVDPVRRYDYDDAPLAIAGAVLGSVMGEVPYDRYGADPNGMIARDGHRIKCKLSSGYDGRYGGYMTHRVCW